MTSAVRVDVDGCNRTRDACCRHGPRRLVHRTRLLRVDSDAGPRIAR